MSLTEDPRVPYESPAPPASPGTAAEAGVMSADYYQSLAAEMLLEALASIEGDHTQAITDVIAHLLAEHDADNRALLDSLKTQAARLATEAAARDEWQQAAAHALTQATIAGQRMDAAQAEAAEAGRELSYERQMRQQTEEAMITMAGRVEESQAEAAYETRENHRLREELRAATTRLINPFPDARPREREPLAFWKSDTREWMAGFLEGSGWYAGNDAAAVLIAREGDGIVTAWALLPAPPAPAAAEGREGGQFPGMPQAKCHGCGLPSHVARCQSEDCPMKEGAAHEALRALRGAIEKASAAYLSAAEREAYASNTNGQGTRGAFGAGEIMGRVSLAQDLLRLFATPAPAAPPAPAAASAAAPGGFPGGNAAGYDAIARILARHCQTCNGHLNGHGECAYCEPEKVASHG